MRLEFAELPNMFRGTRRSPGWRLSWVNRRKYGAGVSTLFLPLGLPPGTGDAFDTEFHLAPADCEKRLPFFLSLARHRLPGDPRGFIFVRRRLP
jgi:hypothetical protein